MLTAKTALEDDHYFHTRAKTEQKGNGFELIIVIDKLESVDERCQKYRIIPEVDWEMRGFKIQMDTFCGSLQNNIQNITLSHL